MNLVDAQQARRAVDRIVGYKLSPLLWRTLAPNLSAGRVQSAALLLIVPWFVRLVVTIDHALINRLLAPNRAQARISALEESRATLAEDAAATLRRIERDLEQELPEPAKRRLKAAAAASGR